jgi:hypothetical protein
MSIVRKRKNDALISFDFFDFDRLNARFRKISKFTNLKKFINFSNVKQWTSNEQKTIVRQIISMITSLLIKKWSYVLKFSRVLINFVLMTQYRFHDENTLFYLDHVFSRINTFKNEFKHLRSSNKNIENDHFNFLKFHVMSHYSEFIRKYETADEYDTSHDEIKHKYMFKKYYERINKRNFFQEQLLWHNKRRVNVLTLKNNLLYDELVREREHSSLKIMIEIKIIRSSRDYLDLIELNMYDDIQKTNESWNFVKNFRQWCLINDLAKWMNMSELISALTIFIKKQRRTTNDMQKMKEIDKYRRESNSSWVKNLYVNFHDFLTCWIRNEQDSSNIKNLIEEKIRCKSNWQNKFDHWRRNYVWMQKQTSLNALNDKLIKQIQIIMTIEDLRKIINQIKSNIYFEILLNLMRSRNKDISNEIFDMIELQFWSKKIFKNSRKFDVKRFFDMSSILRSAHVISNERNEYYVNNYIDWNTYNIAYDNDFMRKDKVKINVYKKSLE